MKHKAPTKRISFVIFFIVQDQIPWSLLLLEKRAFVIKSKRDEIETLKIAKNEQSAILPDETNEQTNEPTEVVS